MKRLKKISIIAMFTLIAMSTSYAQRPVHEIHSMMVYNLIKYVNWPANATSGDFVIGVVGSDDVYKTLNTWYTGKAKGSQKISIKKIGSMSEAGSCHVVYLGKDKSGDFESLKSATTGKSTLLITDKNGLGHKGSGINFKTVGGKLKFELNQSAVDAAKLKVSSQLSGMAIMI